MIVSMPKTAGQDDLPRAEEESSTVSATLEDCYGILTPLYSPTKNSVIATLKLCSLAHLICHGEVDPEDATKSHLLLSKSQLDVRTLIHIMKWSTSLRVKPRSRKTYH